MPRRLITPYPFFRSDLHHLLLLLDFFCPVDLLQSFLVLRLEVFSRFDQCLFAVLEGAEGGLFIDEGLVEEDGFVAEDQADGFLLLGVEGWMGEDYVVAWVKVNGGTFLELLFEVGVDAVDGFAASGDFAGAGHHWELFLVFLCLQFLFEKLFVLFGL
jgi:hypothetical protein